MEPSDPPPPGRSIPWIPVAIGAALLVLFGGLVWGLVDAHRRIADLTDEVAGLRGGLRALEDARDAQVAEVDRRLLAQQRRLEELSERVARSAPNPLTPGPPLPSPRTLSPLPIVPRTPAPR